VQEIDDLADQNRHLDAQVDYLSDTITRLTRPPTVRLAQSVVKLPRLENSILGGEPLRAMGGTKLSAMRNTSAFMSTPRAFNFFAAELADALRDVAPVAAEDPVTFGPQITPHVSTSTFPFAAQSSGNSPMIPPEVPDLPHEYGICARLAERRGGNPAELGAIAIRGNSYDAARERLLPRLVDYTWTKCWTSKNEPGSWVQFDFAPLTVLVARYSIKTYPVAKGFSHLQSWVLQHSLDEGASWNDLDRRQNTNDLNGKSKIGFFSVSSPRPTRMLKIKQIDLNHARDDYLILTNVEFYGEILAED
jgi:hypothetical protein